MTTTYTSYDQLPLPLCADDVVAVLGISRANAYTLMHSKDFPTITIGKLNFSDSFDFNPLTIISPTPEKLPYVFPKFSQQQSQSSHHLSFQ